MVVIPYHVLMKDYKGLSHFPEVLAPFLEANYGWQYGACESLVLVSNC